MKHYDLSEIGTAVKTRSQMTEMGIPEEAISLEENPYTFARDENISSEEFSSCKVEYAKYREKRFFILDGRLYLQEEGENPPIPFSSKEEIDNYIDKLEEMS